jgi:hypothetical protein
MQNPSSGVREDVAFAILGLALIVINALFG